MGWGSPIHWIVVILLIVLLFGAGRVSGLMGEVAKGIKSFRKGLTDEDEPTTPAAPPPPPKRLSDERPAEPGSSAEAEAPPAERGSASEADRH